MSSFSTYRYGALACTIAIMNLINTVCANSIDFSSRTELQQWYGMTDRVMGGRSSTSFYAEENYAVFRGYLSLENNGGFALVSRSLLWVDTSDGDAIHLVSRGDGKRYQLRVGLSQYPGDVAYVADFNSQNGKWQTMAFKPSDFVPMYRGRQLNRAPLEDFSQIQRVSVMIGDKQQGEFELHIASLSITANNQL